LTDRLVQELVTQRRQLMATQDVAAERIAEFEQRVARLQRLFEQRQADYEIRIAELERELAALHDEKRRRAPAKLGLATALNSQSLPCP
jgi:hypothetical protein